MLTEKIKWNIQKYSVELPAVVEQLGHISPLANNDYGIISIKLLSSPHPPTPPKKNHKKKTRKPTTIWKFWWFVKKRQKTGGKLMPEQLYAGWDWVFLGSLLRAVPHSQVGSQEGVVFPGQRAQNTVWDWRRDENLGWKS